MAKEELIEMHGSVTEVLPDGRYRVTLEMSPYDLTKGRITFRHLPAKSGNMPPPPARRY